MSFYAWKHLESGAIVQNSVAPTAEDLFEQAGFGAVRVDEPLKGYLAVRVRRDSSGVLVEADT